MSSKLNRKKPLPNTSISKHYISYYRINKNQYRKVTINEGQSLDKITERAAINKAYADRVLYNLMADHF